MRTTIDSRVLHRLRDSRLFRSTARVGLVGRAVLYLVLAGLALNVHLSASAADRSASTNGALRAIAQTPLGAVLLATAAVGFAAFGLARLVGAATDGREGRLRRLSTAGQGAAYLVGAGVTASFLLGREEAGSEQQREQTTGLVLGLPGGELLVVAAGVTMLAVCAWQVTVAARGHFGDTLDSEQMSGPMQAVVWLVARVGIVARALAYAPVGLFLVLAGTRSDPDQATSLDSVLLELTRSGWGRALVLLVAAGFAVFSVYSLLEARYRQVASGA